MTENLPLPEDLAEALRSQAPLSVLAIGPHTRPEESSAGLKHVDGFKILSEKHVDGDARAAVVNAFIKAHREFDGKKAHCFFPRHALRIESGTNTLVALICFQCGQMHYYVNGAKQASAYGVSDLYSDLFNQFIR